MLRTTYSCRKWQRSVRMKGTVSRRQAILHIPHSSAEIPADCREQFVLDSQALQLELLRMTDWFTDELFPALDHRFSVVRYPVSRLVLDPERFEDDSQEVMCLSGMGLIYTRTSSGDLLREKPSEEEREALLTRYYRPHHDELLGAVEVIRRQAGAALIIDCHSFPSRALPYELDQRIERPEICIGTDRYHTPSWLGEYAVTSFRNQGFIVDINRPFAGALVPTQYFQRERQVNGIMIEINRGLYMNEELGVRSKEFDRVADVVHRVCLDLSERFYDTAEQCAPADGSASAASPLRQSHS